jgi:hypothetical protein
MTDELAPPMKDLLNAREIAALRLVQDLYGGEAKRAAGVLADTIDLSEPVREQFMGSVAARISTLNFEQRRSAAISFREAAAALGGPAVEGALGGASQEVIEVTLQNGNAGVIYTGSPAAVPDVNSGRPNAKIGLGPPLHDRQKTWLRKLKLDAEKIAEVEALPLSGRVTFAERVGRIYQGLGLTGATPHNKEKRTKQLAALLEGRSYVEIAALFNASESSVHVGLSGVANTVHKRVPLETIVAAIPSIDEVSQDTPEDLQDPEDSEVASMLSEIQQKWFKKIFLNESDRANITTIESLTLPQRQHFADRLGSHLSPLILKKNGPYKTARRVKQIDGFIMGRSLEEIAGIAQQDMRVVKADLHNTALVLRNKLTPRDWKRIIEDAMTFTAEQTDG